MVRLHIDGSACSGGAWQLRLLARRLSASALLVALALVRDPAWSQAAGYSLGWRGVSGLAGGSSTGAGCQVTGAVGQTVAGNAQDGGEGFELRGGYGAAYGIHPFTVVLRGGWNLVSVPLIPLVPGLEQVLPASVVGPLWEGTPEGYQPVLRVEPLHGYWIWSAQAASQVMLGVLVTEPFLSVPSGWSLVGPVGGPPYPGLALPLATDPAGAVAGLPWGWHGLGADYQPTVGPLVYGAAYWVYTAVPAVLQLGAE